MDFSDIFRMVNLAVGVFMVLGGIGQFFPSIGVQNVIIPPQVARFASFMFSFVGRGVFYIFIGSIIMGDNWWKYTAGSIIALVGIGYVVLEYIPSIEPPANMRDADAGWGAEQV
ncbi:hypothetical protein LTR28_003899 [Elasticomyces elasticus]|nr:hypothetical protein LTR28_003899 [Elasticomyces elasticus]